MCQHGRPSIYAPPCDGTHKGQALESQQHLKVKTHQQCPVRHRRRTSRNTIVLKNTTRSPSLTSTKSFPPHHPPPNKKKKDTFSLLSSPTLQISKWEPTNNAMCERGGNVLSKDTRLDMPPLRALDV
eukprot:TRINITY_DN2389_c0_g3_i1.p1 TRINITY_DN2389_c0_g3~~TRINITY_DN2389_c0_g3_i1.p1  ORF type:complete len:127 (+),score=0.53 TRINITY_DN2389_c0_g3_i1:95-475(+)